MTNYKQLCAELVDDLKLCDWPFKLKETIRADIDRARAALAEPEPKGPTDAETELVIKPIQPPGRIGMTWQQTIQGLRDVLADESKDAVQMVWQRTRICDAVDLMEANSAALTEPEPEGPAPAGPSDEELLRTYGLAKRDHNYEGPIDDWPKRAERAATVAGLRAVLARWGNHPGSPDSSTPQPVPVSERLPEPGDCDTEGRCWTWAIGTWRLSRINRSFHTHWLPSHALPQPS